MMFLDDFFKNLRLLYEEKGLSQEGVAARCQITPQYFRKILRGKSVPSLTVFMNICIGFGLTPNEMLGYDPAAFQAQCTARREELGWRSIKKSRR